MALSRIEEWLSKQEPLLRGWLAKSGLAVWAIVVPVVLAGSGQPLLLKLAAGSAWLVLTLCLWLLSWLAIYRAKVKSLTTDNEALRAGRGDKLSENELSILKYAHSSYPAQRTREEMKRDLNMTEIDLDFSLRALVSRGFMRAPVGGLWYEGRQNPNSYSIAEKGVTAIAITRS